MKRILLLLIICIAIIFACSSDNESQTTPDVANADFFASYYQKNILPTITKFKQEAETLQQAITDFTTTTTDTNYEKITTQWLATTKAYSKVEVYNFGLIKERFFNEVIFNFPINVEAIESNVAQETNYNTAYFNTQSTVTKGLSTIEYLLYGNNYNTQSAKNDLLNNSYRLNYLIGVCDEIVRNANELLNIWENEYSQTYINANASLCKENALCLSVNQIINVLDITKVTRIGKPAGFESSNNTNTENLVAFRSRSSLLLTKAMLEEVKYVYFTSEANISSLVDNINTNKKISTQIQTTFNKLEQQIELFNNNFYDAINTDAQTIRPLYTRLRELTTYFSVDVTSALSVTTLPTDNDGD